MGSSRSIRSIAGHERLLLVVVIPFSYFYFNQFISSFCSSNSVKKWLQTSTDSWSTNEPKSRSRDISRQPQMIGSQETRSFFLQKWLGKKITSRLKLKTWNFYIQKVSGRYRWRRHTCWSRWDPTRIGMAREPFSWLRKMSWVTLLCTVGPVYYYRNIGEGQDRVCSWESRTRINVDYLYRARNRSIRPPGLFYKKSK